ncbi:MAG: hypothetical protein R2765_05255 [Ferruginibacter sp.]
MAQVACEYSNKVILTSDNPRSEDPMEILHDMQTGVSVVAKKSILLSDAGERQLKQQ